MAMKVQDPLPMLAAQVKAHVYSDYTIRFRDDNYDICSVHGIKPGHSVIITHYQWAPKKQVQVTFIDDFDLTHRYILDRASHAMA